MKTMKACTRYFVLILALMMLFMAFATVAGAADGEEATAEAAQADSSGHEGARGSHHSRPCGSAGAIGMGIAIAKSVEGISRQPEAESKIRTALMLGLVFVETAIIYALIIAVLIIFVL